MTTICASPTRRMPSAARVEPPSRKPSSTRFGTRRSPLPQRSRNTSWPWRVSLLPGTSRPEAEQLWLNVAKVPSARREALDALYALYRATNDLPNLRLTAERLHESSPEEVGLAANAARFALLLDHNAAAGRALAKQAYEKAPNDPAAAVTYAFALYGIGRTAEGIKILETLPPDQLNDPHAAVYAALLYDDENQLDAANKYIALARNGPIFPEEKQLLEEIATRRKNAADSLTPESFTVPGLIPRPTLKVSGSLGGAQFVLSPAANSLPSPEPRSGRQFIGVHRPPIPLRPSKIKLFPVGRSAY